MAITRKPRKVKTPEQIAIAQRAQALIKIVGLLAGLDESGLDEAAAAIQKRRNSGTLATPPPSVQNATTA